MTAVTNEAGTAPARLGRGHYLAYAGGDAANNLAFSMTSMFLLLYYTDVVGISAATVGTLLLVVRVWHAFADILAGQVVDRTHTRWGKFRPYFLFGALPLALLTVATFTVPSGLSSTARLAYAVVSYALFGLVYSLVNIPFGSLASAMTQRPQERAKLGTARSLGTAVSIIVLSFVVAPQVNGSADLQRSLTVITVIFGAVIVGLYLWLFARSRETVARDAAPAGLTQSIRSLGRNRPLLLLCANAVFALTGMFVLQTLQVYYARDVLGNADYFVVLTVLSIGATFVVVPLIPTVVGRFGKKSVYLTGLAVSVAGGLGIALSPPSMPFVAFVAFGVYGLGIAAVQVLMWALQADTVEYGEWESGLRSEGSNYAALSFTRKIGQGLGAAAAAWGIGLGGYVAGATDQAADAVDAVRYVAGLLPAACFAAAGLIMLRYRLTEAAFACMVQEVAARRAVPSALAAGLGRESA